ncbi:hypothetical protein SADUNF_Sadunf16G0052400 [Salix dunnii]|uniref:Uncharacterized protein n=1 Tax=Salix dunnii TaxID=1413687 RepID=A0A835JAH9_9ROSI|nr:hypothetical protein SADUNF_Sadunf16G0052400 [Salix dunnii]
MGKTNDIYHLNGSILDDKIIIKPRSCYELEIQFGRGFCFESEVLELACEHSIVKKQGNNYVIGRKLCFSIH